MTTLDLPSLLAQSEESALGFQSWLIFSGVVITVLAVLVVQGGLMLAHRAQWWQSDGPDHAGEVARPRAKSSLPETEVIADAYAKSPSGRPIESTPSRGERTPRRRSA